MSTLEEHLTETYDIDLDEQEAIALALEDETVPEERKAELSSARFRVDTLDKADWALRKIAQQEARLNEIRAQAEREIQRITEWLERAKAPHERTVEFFTGLLIEYHHNELEADPRKKSITLPAGALKSRAGQPEWTISDEEAFIAWYDADDELQELLPGLVKVKREPSKSAIKTAFMPKDDRVVDPRTGEIVPGVVVAPGQRSFKVEVTP